MDKHMEKVGIHTDYIQLDQLLKWAGIIETSGQIKHFMETSKVFVNGSVCTEKRKKIHINDVVDIEGKGSLIVVRETGKGEEA